MVERVVRIRFVEKIDEAVNDGVDVEDRAPIFTEDVQTDLPLQVDVRVVDLRLTFDLGW